MDPTVVKELATRTAEIATRPQLIDAVNKKTGNKVTDLATARHFLEKSNLVASGGRFTRGELFSALMKLSLLPQTSIAKLANPLCALAYSSGQSKSAYHIACEPPIFSQI
jgi:hypothetical protein